MTEFGSRTTAPMLLRLSPADNVAVATGNFDAGEDIRLDGAEIHVLDRIAVGHKVALCEIPAGAKVIKFGCPIGSATRAIRSGEHVHTHNLKSDYLPTFTLEGR